MAWQCTVQVGMAAWRQLQRFCKKRDPSKHADMESAFLMMWCQSNIFCVNRSGKPAWILTPHHDFLTRDFGIHFASIKIHRSVLDSEVSEPLVSLQSSSRNLANRVFCNALQSRIQTEIDDLTEAIIDRLLADHEDEVQHEDSPGDPPTLRGFTLADQVVLPNEILSPRFLSSQNSVWSSSV